MELDEKQRELLSALADGALQGDELAQALALCGSDGATACWRDYHLIGDVLRAPELAGSSDSARLLLRVRGAMAEVPVPAAPAMPPPGLPPAANDPLFRWKMAAGFASLAAVAAIGWNSLSVLQEGTPQGAQLASGQPPRTAVVTEMAQAGPQTMLRDPRLDELLAAHKQYGGASALQMPAGFLRNATFEAPQR